MIKNVLLVVVCATLTGCGASLVKVEPVKVQESYVPVITSCFDSPPVRQGEIAHQIDMTEWNGFGIDKKIAIVLKRLGNFELYALGLEAQINACRDKQSIVKDIDNRLPNNNKH
jgi:hypothetical protein